MRDSSTSHPFAVHPLFFVLSVALHLVVAGGLLLYSHHHPNVPPPPITEIIEVTMFELQAPAEPTVPVAEPSPVIQPEPEPIPEPEPPEPEPVPEPEPLKIVKPETPVVPPPKVEKPEPVEVPKPKTREELIRERFNNSPLSKDDPAKRQEEQRKAEQQRREQAEALRRMQKTLDQAATSFKPSVLPPASTSKVVGVSAAQMSQYQRYMNKCVTPKVNQLWQQLGPSGLDSLPTAATVRFVVESSGRILSYMFVSRSNSAAVNDAADALGKALMKQGLPPFRQVGLTTEGNAPLSLDFTLEYKR